MFVIIFKNFFFYFEHFLFAVHQLVFPVINYIQKISQRISLTGLLWSLHLIYFFSDVEKNIFW